MNKTIKFDSLKMQIYNSVFVMKKITYACRKWKNKRREDLVSQFLLINTNNSPFSYQL